MEKNIDLAVLVDIAADLDQIYDKKVKGRTPSKTKLNQMELGEPLGPIQEGEDSRPPTAKLRTAEPPAAAADAAAAIPLTE
eukprot:5199270-Pyramimonas_sp.AAC.1